MLLAACLFAVLPFAEIGINDDWSYIHTAQIFARTGRFVYNGWATAMLGWQVVWGAIFANIFGPSFTSIRLSTIPVALACAVLFHAILRRFGINRALASFGTLTLVLSPLFLPLADSFMSDVPGLFSILLCLYLCQRASASSEDRAAMFWLIAAALTNVLSGTVRQIAWLGVLVMVPSCAWLLRKRRHLLAVTAILWLVSCGLIFLCMHWFAQQPYSVPEKLLPGTVTPHALLAVLDQFFRAGLTTLLFCLPVLACGLAFIPRLRGRTRWSALVCLLALCTVFVALKLIGRSGAWLPLWLGNIVNPTGIFFMEATFGVSLPAIGGHLRELILAAVAVSSVAFAAAVWRRPLQQSLLPEKNACARNAHVLLLPFLFAYSALLLPRAAFSGLYDRYLLPILVVVLYLLLHLYQQRVAARPPVLACLVLALVAAAGVAGTHDFFAMDRARVRLAGRLQSAGIQRPEIRGGFEFDATTQVDLAGYMNERRLVNPSGAYHPPRRSFNPDDPCSYWLQEYIPALHPKFVISPRLSSCFRAGALMEISYRTWLPPATRTLYVQSVGAHPGR